MDRSMGPFSIGHGGGMPGTSTITARWPGSGVSVVVLANCDAVNTGLIASRLEELVRRGRAEAPPCPWDEKPAKEDEAGDPGLAAFEGVFLQDGTRDEYWKVTAVGKTLRVEAGWGELTMLPAGTCRFRCGKDAPDSEFFFDFDAKAPRAIREYKGGRLFKRLTAVATAAGSDPAELAAREGRYRSDELGATYTVRRQGWRLAVSYPQRDPCVRRVAGMTRRVFHPVSRDGKLFASGVRRLEFLTGRRGRIRGMRILIAGGRLARVDFRKIG